jgi:hypothetical protein
MWTTCGEWDAAHLMRRRAEIEHARARDEHESGQPAAREWEVERRGHRCVRVVEMRGTRRARAAAEPPIMLRDAGPVEVHDSVAHEALNMTSIATGWRPPTDVDGAVVRSRTAPQSAQWTLESRCQCVVDV